VTRLEAIAQEDPMARDIVPEQNPNQDAGSIPGFRSGTWKDPRTGDVGKVLKDNAEMGISTHLHKHKDGVTLSTYRGGEPVERYNFNTGRQE
jgi:hypothetical protein